MALVDLYSQQVRKVFTRNWETAIPVNAQPRGWCALPGYRFGVLLLYANPKSNPAAFSPKKIIWEG
jgi:hypothetical protein